ncbi:MAG: hypothetical protein PGN13_10165 [Patulibacter minatonensis]
MTQNSADDPRSDDLEHEVGPSDTDHDAGQDPERDSAPARATPSEDDKRKGLMTDRPPQQEPGGDVPPPS